MARSCVTDSPACNPMHHVRWLVNAKELEVFGDSEVSNSSLLAKTLCDEEGELLFSEEDIEELAKKSGNVTTRLTNKAILINGMTGEAEEDLEKNS